MGIVILLLSAVPPSIARPEITEREIPVKIAAIFAETGIASSGDREFITGAWLAVDEINRNGGILGRRIELVVLDNHSTPIGSVAAARKAVEVGAIAVIGSAWSSHSMAIAECLQESAVPMITPGSTNPDVTRIGDYIFRVCFTDHYQGNVAAEFARSYLKAEKAAVIKNLNEKYSIDLAMFFRKRFVELGGEIVYEGGYNGKAVDFKCHFENIATSPPDVVYVPGYDRDSGFIIRQGVRMNIGTTFIGGDGWTDAIVEYAGDSIEGAYCSSSWNPFSTKPEMLRFLSLFRKETGRGFIKSAGVVLTYDAVNVLADAIKRSGGFSRPIIRDALSNTKEFKGVTGEIEFNESGDPKNKPVVILNYRDGGWKHIVTVNKSMPEVDDLTCR